MDREPSQDVNSTEINQGESPDTVPEAVAVRVKKNSPLRNIFITGMVAILPLVVTVYIIKFLYGLVVSNLMPLVQRLTGTRINLPDSLMGIFTIIFFVLIVLLIGLLTRIYVGRMIISFVEKTVTTIPVVNKIYNAIKQMIDSFKSSTNNFEKVVLVEFPKEGVNCVGFVVRNTQVLFNEVVGEPCYNVFVPTAPNPTSGFITVIPVSKCTELPITVEEGVKFVFSVGLINTPSFDLKPLIKEKRI